jgi:glycosyltransferase involved in cell wall biosynthesis
MDHVWVVVAAYNEASVIGRVVQELHLHGQGNVVVVDDASSDETGSQARAHGATVLRHAINRGQGAALQTGIDFALKQGADVLVTFDADGQHCPDDIDVLLAALRAGEDVALGSRFLGKVEGASHGRRVFLRVAAAVSNALSGLRLTDAHCGLRAFKASCAHQLRFTQDRMSHASEILMNIHQHALRYREVPVTIRYTEYSKRKGQTPLHAVSILMDLLFAHLTARRRS